MANRKLTEREVLARIEANRIQVGEIVLAWGLIGKVKALVEYDRERKAVVQLKDVVLTSPPPTELRTNTIVIEVFMLQRLTGIVPPHEGIIDL